MQRATTSHRADSMRDSATQRIAGDRYFHRWLLQPTLERASTDGRDGGRGDANVMGGTKREMRMNGDEGQGRGGATTGRAAVAEASPRHA